MKISEAQFIYVGDRPVKRVYRGSTLFWEAPPAIEDIIADIAWNRMCWATANPNWSPPANGSTVQTWDCAVGTPSPTQATVSARPTYRASVASLNNRPALEFDGGDGLSGTGGTNIAQPNSCVVIGQVTSLSATRVFCGGLSGVNNGIVYYASDGDFRTFGGATGSDSGIDADTQAHCLIGTYDGANSFIEVDGVAGTPSNTGANAMGGFMVGQHPGNINRFVGFIALVGWTDTPLSTAQRALVRAWAQDYYGTP